MNSIIRNLLAAGALLGLSVSARAAQEDVRYFYDDAGRLVAAGWSAGISNAAAGYQYDANGNRTGTLHVAAGDTNLDTNADGMPDLGELVHFGTLDVDGADDPDGDSLVNSNELALAGDPFRADTDADTMSDFDESIAGTALNNAGSLFRIDELATEPGNRLRVGWDVYAGRTYQFQTSTGQLASWTTNFIFDCTNTGSYATSPAMADPRFFRARVRKTE